ncbi:unnamed protein product, partial [Mesorhabditis belari]|uniref:receptor protein serine/threonine kinase n=1 Tax=Mesorhabditis belari TaxID=2138241 RepID=A0AAF3EK56_9BILA
MKRIAHRDVKLENIFVTEGFELKLGDFGIFKRFEDGKEVAIDNAGTPNYMAPELLETSSQLSEDDLYQCDVFAAGLVLWEATFRERLPNSSSGNSPITLHFPSTTSPDVQQCFDLIERCSSSKISIKSRLTTEQALLEVESLGEVIQ